MQARKKTCIARKLAQAPWRKSSLRPRFEQDLLNAAQMEATCPADSSGPPLNSGAPYGSTLVGSWHFCIHIWTMNVWHRVLHMSEAAYSCLLVSTHMGPHMHMRKLEYFGVCTCCSCSAGDLQNCLSASLLGMLKCVPLCDYVSQIDGREKSAGKMWCA